MLLSVELTTEQEDPAEGEGYLVMMMEDGTLLSDSGPRTVNEILQVCANWKAEGTAISVVIIAYTQLESNNRLSNWAPLLEQLRSSGYPF